MAGFNLGNLGSTIMGGLSSLFGGGSGGGFGGSGSPFQSMAGGTTQGSLNPTQLKQQNFANNSGGGGIGGMFSSLLGGGGSNGSGGGLGPVAKGIGTLFGSQLIGNPKTPQLPQSFYDFQKQANAGGPAAMQGANQYYQGVLSGNNQDAYDASTHALDLNYQEQVRQLNGMYKSLRPGTDPASDTTYQRDLSNLNDQYARQKAQTHAQVQGQAAQGATQLGAEQSSQQLAAMEAQVQQIASQWGMDYAQKEALRNALMQLGGNMASYGTFQSMFPNAFGKAA